MRYLIFTLAALIPHHLKSAARLGCFTPSVLMYTLSCSLFPNMMKLSGRACTRTKPSAYRARGGQDQTGQRLCWRLHCRLYSCYLTFISLRPAGGKNLEPIKSMNLADGVLSEDGSWAICTDITLMGEFENTCMQAPAAVRREGH